MTPVIGIDLGTTFSLIASVEHSQPRIIADEHGERLVPSVVGFSPQGELLVGTPARNQYVLEPDNTVKSIKRKMGTDARLNLAGREYSPQEISAFILRRLKDGVERQHGVDLRKDRRSLSRLVRAAEVAKIALSDHPFAHVAEEFISRKNLVKQLHLDVELPRHQFEDMLRPLVQSTLESVDQALSDAGLRARDLHQVLLVGGSTRIPLVRRMLAEHLGQEPQTAVHPDEAVALGAAIQGAIIAGEPIEAVLVDVAPHSLGIEAASLMLGYMLTDRYSVLIPRNTAIPCTRSEAYYTIAPKQDRARVRVYQGDQAIASRNELLGEFLFEGISPDPEGLNREVLVRFDYDVDGIVQVSAVDRRSRRSEGIKVTASSRQRLSAAEKAHSQVKLASIDRRLEREIDALLRRSERLMVSLEAAGQAAPAEDVLTLAGDLERARQTHDYAQAQALMETLGELIYSLQD